jgi:hypothetical protein
MTSVASRMYLLGGVHPGAREVAISLSNPILFGKAITKTKIKLRQNEIVMMKSLSIQQLLTS